ncbi:hypothetical protein [Hymenobacter saemangeumensis]|uniref:hypothetical protein n=1 Tax=Hymenobacter saemangeumensis TaxID=1084522 RepID=UPI0031EA909A
MLSATPSSIAGFKAGELPGLSWGTIWWGLVGAVTALLLYLAGRLWWQWRDGRRAAAMGETRVYFAIGRALGWGAIGLGVVMMGLFMMQTAADSLMLLVSGAALALAGGVVMFFELRRLLNRRPQLIMNAQGIQWQAFPLRPWSQIRHARVELVEGSSDEMESSFHLCYTVTPGLPESSFEMSVDLKLLAVDPIQLEQDLRRARGSKASREA